MNTSYLPEGSSSLSPLHINPAAPADSISSQFRAESEHIRLSKRNQQCKLLTVQINQICLLLMLKSAIRPWGTLQLDSEGCLFYLLGFLICDLVVFKVQTPNEIFHVTLHAMVQNLEIALCDYPCNIVQYILISIKLVMKSYKGETNKDYR